MIEYVFIRADALLDFIEAQERRYFLVEQPWVQGWNEACRTIREDVERQMADEEVERAA